MAGTMSRAFGTSAGAPGAQNVDCMSITIKAVCRASNASNQCSLPRRAITRSTMCGRMLSLGMNIFEVAGRKALVGAAHRPQSLKKRMDWT